MTWIPPEVSNTTEPIIQSNGWVPPEVKKKEEFVGSGVSESTSSFSLSSTPDRTFPSEVESVDPIAVTAPKELSFRGDKETTPINNNLMGLFNKKEEITKGDNAIEKIGVVNSIAKAASEAEYPTKFLFNAKEAQRKLDAIPKHFPQYAGNIQQIKDQIGTIKPSNIDTVNEELAKIEDHAYRGSVGQTGALKFDSSPQWSAYEKEAQKSTPISAATDKLLTDTDNLIKAASTKENDGVLGAVENYYKSTWGSVGKYFKDYANLMEDLKANPAIKEIENKLERINKGENVDLTTDERILAQSFLDNYNAHEKLDKEIPFATKVGETVGTSLGFMLEFYLTGKAGVGASGKITKGLTELAATGAKASLGKRFGVGLAAKLAQSGIQTAWMPTLWKNTAIDVSKGDGYVESLSKNYYKTFAENFSERIFLKNPWDKSMVGSVDNVINRMGINIHSEKGAAGALLGTLEEATEEKISELMTAPLDYNNFKDAWKGYWDWDKNKLMLASVAAITAPMGIVSSSVKAYDNVKLDRIGKLLPSGIRSELDVVLNDRNLSLKEQFDLIGTIVEDHVADKTLGEKPAEAAGNIIRYAQQKTKSNVVSAVEERQEERIKEQENPPKEQPTTLEEQALIDADETKPTKEPKAPVVAEAEPSVEPTKKPEPVVVFEIQEVKELVDWAKDEIVDPDNKQSDVDYYQAIIDNPKKHFEDTISFYENELNDPDAEVVAFAKGRIDRSKLALEKINELESRQEPKPTQTKPIDVVSEAVEPQTKQKGVVVPSETKVAEKQQKEVVVEPTTKKAYEGTESEFKYNVDENNNPILYRGEKEGNVSFDVHGGVGSTMTIDKSQAEGYGEVKEYKINPDAKTLTLVDQTNFNNRPDLEKLRTILGYDEKAWNDLTKNGDIPMYDLWNNEPTEGSWMNKIKKAGYDIVFTEGLDGAETYVLNKKSITEQQQKQPLVGEQTEVTQLKKEEDEKGVSKSSEKADEEKTLLKVAETAKISPKNLRDVYKAGREIFGLNKAQALAQAIITDRIVGSIAKKVGKTKKQVYSELEYRKGADELLQSKVNTYFQAAWHGSPYQFDKFRTENIGTGEGAQAFGWGLYFTDLKSIAQDYAKKLSKGKVKYKGELIDYFSSLNFLEKHPEIETSLSEVLKEYPNDMVSSIVKNNPLPMLNSAVSLLKFDSISSIKETVERGKENFDKYGYYTNLAIEAAVALKLNEIGVGFEESRNLYKVELHKGKTTEQYDWLVWDKQLTEKQRKQISDQFKKDNIDPHPFLKEDAPAVGSGRQVYELLTSHLKSDKEASLFLLRAGIDGIKYPAESIARGATSDNARGFNYVVFDENAVTIEEVIKFQNAWQKNRGAMLVNDGKAIVYALTDPNVSTPLHELAHVYERYMLPREKADVLKWTGDKTWTVATSEKFARGFERYLAEGVAPTTNLKAVFERFKTWLNDIYNGIKQSDIDVELNADMKRLYDSMLTGKPYVPSKEKVAVEAPQVAKKEYKDVDDLLFQEGEVKFQDTDKTERHTKALENLIAHLESEKSKDVAKEVNNYLKEKGNPISQELVDKVLKEKGYAGKVRKINQGDLGAQEGVVEGAQGEVPVGNDGKDKKTPRSEGGQINTPPTVASTHKIKTTETTKIGHFAVRVTLDESKVPQPVKDFFKENEVGAYDSITHEQAEGLANGIAAAHTYEELKAIVLEGKIHQTVRGALLVNIADIQDAEFQKAKKEGNKAAMAFWADESRDFLKEINDRVHDTALFLNYFGSARMMDRFEPYHYVREAEQSIAEEREQAMNGIGGKIHKKSREKAVKAAKKLRTNAIDGALNSPKVKKIVEENKEKEPVFVKPDRLKELKQKEKSLIEKLKKAMRGGTLSSGGLNTEALEALGELAVVYMEEVGYVAAKAVKRLINAAKKAGVVLTEDQANKLIPTEIDGKKVSDLQAEEETQKAAEKLAQRIISMVDDATTPAADAIKKMVAELAKKVSETIPEKAKKPIVKDVFALIRNAINDKVRRREVWLTAKDEAISKIEESNREDIEKERMIATIEEAYDEATKFMFAMAEAKQAVREVMKQMNISVSQLSNMSIADIKAKIEEISDSVIAKINVEEDTSKLNKAIRKSLASEVIVKIKANKESKARREAEKERKAAEKEGNKKTDMEIIAEKLGTRLVSEATETQKLATSKIQQAVNTLLGKYKERDQQKPKGELKTDIQKIAEAIRNKDEYADAWAEANIVAIEAINNNKKLTDAQKQEAIDKVNEVYKKATSFTFTEAQIDRAIKRKMADLKIRVDQVVRDFYDLESTERGRLKDALIQEAGLSEEQSAILAKAIEERFDLMMTEGKKKIVEKYIGKIKEKEGKVGQMETKARKDAVAEFLELINIGAFDSKAFREAYATAVGLPVFTNEQAEYIKNLAEEIKRQKTPEMKHKMTQKLMAERQAMAGFSMSDVAQAAWYGNVLGNIKTQERNILGAFSGISTNLMAEALVTGRPGAILRGYIRSFKEASAKAKDVMKTGYSPFSKTIDIPNTTEILKARNFLKYFITYWKYTGRFMNSADLFNATTGKLAFAELLANEELNVNRTKMLFSSQYRKQVNDLVEKYLKVDKATTDKIRAEIEADALEYGYTEQDKALIYYGAIDRLRPTKISEQAIRFGIFATGNVKAYGTLGFLSDMLAKIFRNVIKLPVWYNKKTGKITWIAPLSFIAAFTKIAGNVGTMSMNYIPGIGAYRIAVGGYGAAFNLTEGKIAGLQKYAIELTEREKKSIWGRQIAGLVSMTLLYLLSDPGDDDDPLIRVTANGTGDYTENNSIKGAEWQEYSIGFKSPTGGRIWFSYKYTPLLLPLSMIGSARDAKKYVEADKDKSEMSLLLSGAWKAKSALADMTAVKSMNDFMTEFFSTKDSDYNKMVKTLERTLGGFYTPGIYRDAVDAVETMTSIARAEQYDLSVKDPMKGVPEMNARLMMERFAGNNPITIIKRINEGGEYTDRRDVYGRKVNKIMPYSDVIKISPESSEEDKLIFRHQSIMGNPSDPSVKQTFFFIDNPDGTTQKIFLNQSDPKQDYLWHKYIILRGKAIVEAIKNNSYLDEESYKDQMKSAIEDATEDARYEISYELNSNKPENIKEWQIKK